MRKRLDIRGQWAGALVIGSTWLLTLSAACDALDPVETVSLCEAAEGVISQRCDECQKPPYSKQCPQCQGERKHASCVNAQRMPDELDAQVTDGALDGSSRDGDVVANDGQVGPAADGGDAALQDAALCEALCNAFGKLCDEATGDCHDCILSSDCTGDDVCSTDFECVACNTDVDCKPSAPHCTAQHACVACTAGDESCEGRDATPVCDTQDGSTTEGMCVQCTGTEYAACKKAPDNTPYVCDSKKRECTKLKKSSVSDCGSCVSDAQCMDGQACAAQRFGNPEEEVGHFCFWKLSAAPSQSCSNIRPYKGTMLSVAILDGPPTDLCMPNVTTCPALNDTNQACESTTSPGTADDARCGFTHTDENYVTHVNQDGFCIDTDASAGKSFRCTTPCNNTVDDCPGPSCNTTFSPDLCSL